MIEISEGPVYATVENAESREIAWLKDFLKVDVPNAKHSKAYKGGYWDGKKSFINQLGRFPSGLCLHIRRMAEQCGLDVSVAQTFSRVKPNKNASLTLPSPYVLRDYQKDAIMMCLYYQRGIVAAATNAGKTVIMGALCRILAEGKHILILTHRKELLLQTRDRIEEVSGIPVGLIDSKNCADFDKYCIAVGMIPTLHKRYGTCGVEDDWIEKSDVLFVDEAHHSKSKSWQEVVRSCEARMRIGFTGSAPTDAYNKFLTYSFLGPVIYEISNDVLIEQGVSAKPIVKMVCMKQEDGWGELHKKIWTQAVNEINDKKEELRIMAERTKDPAKARALRNKANGLEAKDAYGRLMWLAVEDKAIVNSSKRNTAIQKICETHSDKSILIIVDKLEHGDVLKGMLSKEGRTVRWMHGSAEDRTESLQKFKDGDVDVLISSPIIQEGVDISRIGVLIIAAGKKSRTAILQRVGRALRKDEGSNSVFVYDFKDSGHKYLDKHYDSRYKVYSNEGFDIEEVSL